MKRFVKWATGVVRSVMAFPWEPNQASDSTPALWHFVIGSIFLHSSRFPFFSVPVSLAYLRK